MHFRNRFSLVLVSLAIISAMSFAAAGANPAAFSFIDSVQQFFGIAPAESVVNLKPNQANGSDELRPNAPLATTYVWDASTVSPTSGSDANIASVAFGTTQGNNNGTTTLISTTSGSTGYTGASGTSNFGAACKVGVLSTSTSTYFPVTLTPASGYQINLTSITLGSRGTSTGPTAITIYSSIDNFATAIGSATVLSNSTWALSTITFSGSSLTGVAGAAVTLRIYGSGGAGSPSANTANWRIDDVSLLVSATSTGGSPTKLAITNISPTSPTAGSGFSVTVQSQDGSNVASNVVANTDFTLSNTGGGTIGGTTTGTVAAGTNSVTVTGVTLSNAAAGATLTATRTSGDTLTAGTSAPFNVLAAANQIAFVGVPAAGVINTNLSAFTVEARRPDSSVDTTYTGNIVVSKATGTGNLSGTLTKPAVAGVATFNDLQFDTGGNFTLNADSSGVAQISSGSITITTPPKYQSKQTGNWNDFNSWQVDTGSGYVDAITGQTPSSTDDTIVIRNGHTITVGASVTVDQVTVETGGTLSHSGGTLTVSNGSGDDISVQNGGVFNLGTTAPAINASAVVNINTGGTLRVSTSGLTANGVGVNGPGFVYSNASILEYTPTSQFSASGVTFFPNVDASTIPIFRLSSTLVGNVGGSGNTVINGVFETTLGNSVTWTGTGTKTFRNGIRGAGDVNQGGAGQFIISGTAADLGGTGVLTLGNAGLQISSSSVVTLSSAKTISGLGSVTVAGTLNTSANSYSLTVVPNLIITTGAFVANASTINIGGNWTNGGTFTAGTSTVNLNGTGAQLLEFDSTFYNLSITTSNARTVSFEPSKTQTVTNALALAGTAGNLLSLRSADNVGEWFLVAPVTRTASFVDVQLSNASGGQTMTATNSVNSGNNTNWTFVVPNQPPIAVDDIRSTDQNNAMVTTAGSLIANDIDPDGPSLSVSSVGNGLNGVVFISGPNVTFTPNNGFTGIAGFDYTVTDGEFSDTGHVTVTVNPDATAPSITYTPITNSAVDTAKTLGVTVTDNVGVTSVAIFYAVGSGVQTPVACVLTVAPNYDCTIPAPGLGSAVRYYVAAVDALGNTATNPSSASPNLYTIGGAAIPAGTYTNVSFAGGSSLGGDITVANVLDLSGVVTGGTFTLALDCNAAVTGAGVANYVDGAVLKAFCASSGTPFSYPVGQGGYSPVDVTITALATNPSSLTVTPYDATLGGFDPLGSLSRNWELTETGELTATLLFHYLDADVNGDEFDYRVWRREGNGSMTNLCAGSPCVDIGLNTLGPVAGVTTFSRWTGSGPLAPTAAEVTLGGRVMTSDGRGVKNAVMVLTGNSLVQPKRVVTGPFGYYQFEGLEAGETYVVTVNSKRFMFSVPSRVISVPDSVSDADFIAMPQE